MANGEDARRSAIDDPPDLVLSDVMMPVLDGFGLVDALRASPRTRSIPVILLSARAGEDARIEGLGAGADDYLVKPFSTRELLARIQTHIALARLRRSAEQTVRMAEERLRLAVESADLGTWDHDLVSGEMTWSERCRVILGIPVDAESDFDLFLSSIHPEDRDRVAEQARASLDPAGSREFHEEFRVVWPDGSVHWILSRGRSLFEQSPQGPRAVRVVGTAMDVTERRRSEASMRETQRLESLGLLAGGIAHDFNNLLTGVIGNASFLEGEFPAGSLQAESSKALMEAADRMAKLTGQMLAYSGRGRFLVEPLDLSRQVMQIVSLVQASISKNVRLHMALDNNLPTVEADGSQLQQVIMNLVINAAEAVDTGQGVVEVATHLQRVGEEEMSGNVTRQQVSPGEYAVLTVRDTGCGMDESTRVRIFDPFFTTKFAGRGLRLSAVLGIVRGHRGLLTVDSQRGVGTTVRVYFPVSQKEEATETARDRATGAGSGTVLIVDDENIVRSTSKVMLSSLGYRVMTACDGAEAVQIFASKAEQIDLVILDMTMPVMGGEETLRRMVALRPGVVVLGSSGYDEREAQRRFGEHLAGFLQKPYTAAQLRGKVAGLLANR